MAKTSVQNRLMVSAHGLVIATGYGVVQILQLTGGLTFPWDNLVGSIHDSLKNQWVG